MDYHIVGIAGAGMSGIAHLLLDQGFSVSGSDRQANGFTVRLQQRGVSLAIGHDASFGANAKVVIATSAVPDDHVELVAARAAGTPVLRRADVWHRWSQERSIIAVAGTHGKSTTTAMLALLLLRAGYDVGFLLGAEFPLLGTSARWGDSDAPLVIEADEYDGAFFGLLPDFAVVTSVEWDHPDCYPTEAAYREAFAQFASQARYALVVSDQVPRDWRDELSRDATVGDAGSQQRQSVMTYGLRDETDYAATPGRGNVSADRNVACWQHWWVSFPAGNGQGDVTTLGAPPCAPAPVPIPRRGGDNYPLPPDPAPGGNENAPPCAPTPEQGEDDAPPCGSPGDIPLALAIPGEHNVRNALAALGIAHLLGLDMYAAAESLAEFRGVARRFEIKGEVDGIIIIDDYAHHPTEATATLAAARQRYGNRRILAYLQPHTYSRTLTLLHQWGAALADADILFIGEIYPSRETPAQAGNFSDSPNPQETLARHLVEQIAMHHPDLDVSYVGTIDEAPLLIDPFLVAGDVLITMGAGDGVFVGEQIVYRRGRGGDGFSPIV